jgi:tetratricopeptide (TPR) repeat protein
VRLSVAIALVLLPVTASAQSGMIRGKVRANNGVTVNNATVELKQATGGVISQVATRNDGDFEFTGLRAGEYEVHVTAGGYEPAVQLARLIENIGVRSPSAAINEVVNLEITIKPRSDPTLAPPGISFVQDVPSTARAAYTKGIAKIREGKSEEGIALLREATTEFSDYFDAHFALGGEYYRLGKDSEAVESLERARLINDREAAVYYMFGMVMARQQKFGVAEYAFGKAAELNANFVLAHFNHGVALIEVALRTGGAGEIAALLADADRELDRAWDLSGKRLNGVFLQRSRIYQKRGDKEAAARELESYLKAEPAAENAAALKQKIVALRAGK